jgi:hypothetical protein
LTLWRMICVGSEAPRAPSLLRTIGARAAGDGLYDEPERACSYACGG